MLSRWSYLLLALAAVPFESQAAPEDQLAGYPRHHAIEGAMQEAVVPVAGRGMFAQLLPRKSKKSLLRSSEAGRRKSNNKNKHKQHQSQHNSTTTVDDEFTSTFSGASSTATRSHKQKHKQQHQNHGHHNSTRTAEVNTASSTATESSKHRHKQNHQHGHHHKTSLTSLSSTSTAEETSSTADPTAEAIADMVRRQSIKASDVFCGRFTDSCSDTCSSRSLSVTANNCGTASKIGTASGFTFQCQCGSKDYTVTALAGSVLDPTTSTAVQVVTRTSTRTSTSSIVKTVIGTTTTTTLSTTTSVTPSPQRTTVTISSNPSPPTVKKSSTTTLTVPTTTIQVTSKVPVMTVTETCEDEDESTSTGDQSTATIDQTSTAGDEQATTSTASASNQGSTAAATNVCAALNKRSMPNRRSQLEARAAPTFCQLYAASCAVSCASNGGVKTQTCTVASKNSYGLLCTCKDGTSDTQHALASIQGQASTVTSTTTSTKPATIITRRTSTLSATSTSIKKTTIRTTLLSSTSTTFKTVVLPATSTVTSLTVKTVTPSSTIKTSTTLTTFLSTRTVTITAGSTATPAQEVEVGSVGQLQIIDATSSEVYGLLSATLDDDAYAYTLDPTSEDGMSVTVIQSSLTAQAGLLGLQMSANQGTAPYLYLGLETQQLSDSGVQPSTSEFLLFTDVAAKSTTLIPTKTNSDSNSYLAQPWLFTITDPSTGILSSTWTNPSGTTKSVVMQHFLICDSTTVDSSCFLTAASSLSTFDDFETDGYSISNVNLRFVVS